jgi:7-carboxy-7-deazaguanine synthase
MTDTLNIISIFESIDGEVNGFHQGTLTTFIRTAQCNLRCAWCDTEYSFKSGMVIDIDDIIRTVKRLKPKKVTLTGGEPLIQKNSVSLIMKLVKEGYDVSVETNGTFIKPFNHPKVSWVYDYKLPSSKMEQFMLLEKFNNLNENDYVKFVIANDNDFMRSIEIRNSLDAAGNTSKYAYSPVPGYATSTLVDNLLKKGKGDEILSLQIHKIIWPTCGAIEEH